MKKEPGILMSEKHWSRIQVSVCRNEDRKGSLLFSFLKKYTKLGGNKQRRFSIKDENLFAHTEFKITVLSVFVKMKTFNRQLEINFREQGD